MYDPWADAAEAQHEYGIMPVTSLENGQYDAVILAVAHEQRSYGAAEIRALGKANHVLYGSLEICTDQSESTMSVVHLLF